MTEISTEVPKKGPFPTWELEGHVKIPEEYKLLLTEVCSDCQHVRIEKEFSIGKSGAKSYLFRCDTRPLEVAKFDHPYFLKKEFEAYDQYVAPVIPNQYRVELRNELRMNKAGTLGVIIYNFLGSNRRRGSEDSDLLRYYELDKKSDIGDILQKLFQNHEAWHEAPYLKRELLSYSREYDRLLPVSLVLDRIYDTIDLPSNLPELTAGNLHIEEINQLQVDDVVRLQGFEVVDNRDEVLRLQGLISNDMKSNYLRIKLNRLSLDEYPPGTALKPVYAVIKATRETLLNDFACQSDAHFENDFANLSIGGKLHENPLRSVNAMLKTSSRPVIYSIIHGDLNLRNIMVDPNNSGVSWFIDFADTRIGPTLLDFQRLEEHVISSILVPAMDKAGMNPNSIVDILNLLHNDNLNFLRPLRFRRLRRPLILLQKIRLLAKPYLEPDNDWTEYYRGLFIVLIGALKFERDNYQRDVLLVAAATTQHYINPPHSPYKPKEIPNMRNFLVGAMSATIVALLVILYLVLSFPSPPDDVPDLVDETATAVSQTATAIAISPSTAITTPSPIPTNTSMPTATSTETPAPLSGEPVVSPAVEITPSNDRSFGENAEEALVEIQRSGKLTVAASIESGPYTSKSGEKFAGFEVELVREFARRWFELSADSDPEAEGLTFDDANVRGRLVKVIEPGIDFLIGSVTYLPERCDPPLSNGRICTNGYSADPQALVVPVRGPVTEYCDPDLDSPLTTVVVLTGTTGDVTRDKYKKQCGFNSDLQIQYVSSREDALSEVLNQKEGTIKVYKSNFALLEFAIRADEKWQGLDVITGPSANDETYGIWLNENHEGLRELINETLITMRQDGTFGRLCQDFNGTQIGNNCNFEFDGFEPPMPARVKIIVAIDRTGSGNPLGHDQKVGADIAKEYVTEYLAFQNVNNFTLDVEFADARSDNTTAREIFEEYSRRNRNTNDDEDDYVVIIGPTYSEQAREAHPIANDSGIVVIATSNTADGVPQGKDFVFRTSAPVAIYAKFAVAQVQAEILNGKVALIYLGSDAFTESEASAFRKAVTNTETLDLVYDEAFTTEDYSADFDEQIAKILSHDPGLIIISGRFKDGVRIVRELRKREFSGRIIGGNGMNASQIFSACGIACDGVVIAQAYDSNLKSDINRKSLIPLYQEQPEAEGLPSQITAQIFTAIQIISEALVEVNNDTWLDTLSVAELRIRLRDQLRSEQSFDTPLGKIWFDREGEICQSEFRVASIQIDDTNSSGQFKLIGSYSVPVNDKPGEECYQP